VVSVSQYRELCGRVEKKQTVSLQEFSGEECTCRQVFLVFSHQIDMFSNRRIIGSKIAGDPANFFITEISLIWCLCPVCCFPGRGDALLRVENFLLVNMSTPKTRRLDATQPGIAVCRSTVQCSCLYTAQLTYCIFDTVFVNLFCYKAIISLLYHIFKMLIRFFLTIYCVLADFNSFFWQKITEKRKG